MHTKITRARDFKYLSSSGTFLSSHSLSCLIVALREVTLLMGDLVSYPGRNLAGLPRSPFAELS